MPDTNTIEQFLRVRQAFGAHFTGDGSHLAFLMNLTGTAQVYCMEEDGGWPALVTDFENRVMEVWTIPRQPGLLFAMDQGGNENAQLYYINQDGSGLKALTDNPEAMYNLGAISPDGQWLAITTNVRNQRDYDVYLLETGQPFSEAHCIAENQGWWRAVDFSEDLQHLLLVTHKTNIDHDLYELDINTGERTLLTPHTGEAQYNSARYWGRHGDILTITDEGREFAGLAMLERSLPLLKWLGNEKADVDTLSVHAASQQYAYTVNREGYSELFLVRADNVRRVPALSNGVIAGVDWNPGGTKLAVTFHSAAQNPDIYRVDAQSLDAVRVTCAPRGGLSFSRFTRPELAHYTSFDGLSVPVWIYQPPLLSSREAPVVISVHGGPESQERPGFNAIYQYLLQRGFAVAAPNVRGSAGYGKTYIHLDDVRLRMNSVKDLAALVAWLAGQQGLNAHRTALMGGSYGGFMVLAGLSSFPDLFAAGVDIVGIANLETFLEHTSPYRRRLREAEYGSLEHDREFFREISPIHHVDRVRAPLLIVHGQNDPRVPVDEAEQMVAQLRARQQPVEYLHYSDEGHGVVKLKNRLTLYPKIAEFLTQHLMN